MVAGLLLLALLEGSSPEAPPPASTEEVERWLAGTFDTKDQAALDPEVPLLRAVVVLVPKSRLSDGAPVLYREEARFDRLERPERQCFLRLEEDGSGRVVVREFGLKGAAAAAGKWRTPEVLALFGRNDVRERPGCAVALARVGDHFEGSAPGPGCAPALLGASRSSSEIRLWPGRMETWERSFDAKGEQVSGPRKGPVRWEKRSPLPPEQGPAAGGGA